ncbi:MAG: DUF3226 domain-containing protein [Snowella sp.]|nr:DUF3226 domain-containing protein [Snowella sp.]
MSNTNPKKSWVENPKKLWVEGATDKRVIPYLMEKNGIRWPDNPPPVFIKDHGGCNILSKKLTESEYLSTQLQTSGLTHLGIIVDADTELLQNTENKPAGRWQSLRDACLKCEYIESLPEKFPSGGLIQNIDNDIKFGIWIMPDNQNQGMLETFLAYLVPDQSDCLWQFARKAAQEARENYQANFKEVHRDKANIYTWLAWQDEPGRQLHEAINETIFNATHPKAQDFVNWFKNLYDL